MAARVAENFSKEIEGRHVITYLMNYPKNIRKSYMWASKPGLDGIFLRF